MVFKKGNCANPGGRRKQAFPFTKRDIHTHFHKWVELIETGKMSDAVRLRACKELVVWMTERMYGKPHQALDIKANQPLAAVVNISLGSDGELGIPSTIDPTKQMLTMKRDENSISREVKAELPTIVLDSQANDPPAETPTNQQDGSDLPDWLD